MLNKIKFALQRFMYGRYGMDELSKFLLLPVTVLIILNMFLTGVARNVVYVLNAVLIFYTYFRMFSKNIYKRSRENSWFIGKRNYLKTRISQSRQYRFFDCPNCKSHLRVPRGVGKITITCKKCGTKFDRRA